MRPQDPPLKYGVSLVLAEEEVDRLGWLAFADLDRALRRHGPWPAGKLGYWVPRLATRLQDGTWVVCFQCWPLGWGECPACQGSGTSWDESTGGRCWDCRGGGVLPTR